MSGWPEVTCLLARSHFWARLAFRLENCQWNASSHACVPIPSREFWSAKICSNKSNIMQYPNTCKGFLCTNLKRHDIQSFFVAETELVHACSLYSYHGRPKPLSNVNKFVYSYSSHESSFIAMDTFSVLTCCSCKASSGSAGSIIQRTDRTVAEHFCNPGSTPFVKAIFAYHQSLQWVWVGVWKRKQSQSSQVDPWLFGHSDLKRFCRELRSSSIAGLDRTVWCAHDRW